MPNHDQLLKDLLRAFFADLINIIDPRTAAGLRLEEVSFADQEAFTDMPEGERTNADLVARVPTRDHRSRLILTHIEVEGRATRRMARRLWRYYLQLHLRHGLPVLPVVIYLRGGQPDITSCLHQERVLDRLVCEFHYLAFGLSRSDAELYVTRSEPLAWALAALMRPRTWERARLKLECLKRIARADVDPARRFLLVNCVESYIQLDQRAAAEFEALLEAADEREEVRTMEMTWAEKLEAKGEQRGMQQLLLDLLTRRFGPLPEAVTEHVRSITATKELSSLAGRVLIAQSLEEMGLVG